MPRPRRPLVSRPRLRASVDSLPTADFFDFESLLSEQEQRKLAELREFLAAEIAPFATEWWNNAEFPAHILPKLAALELSAPAQRGYSHLFAGLVIAEMTRVDTSIATFFLVHHDLFVESLYGFGSEEQKARLLDDAAKPPHHRRLRAHRTGARLRRRRRHGNAGPPGFRTTGARRRRRLLGAQRRQALDRQRDVLRLHARVGPGRGRRRHPRVHRGRDPAGRQPEPDRDTRSPCAQCRTRTSSSEDVRVAEADRFAGISSFEDTNELLRGSRIMVAWQAVGQQLAAFDVARQYAVERQQFGRPLAKFQLIQQQLVTMLGNAVASMGMMVRIAQLQQDGAADMAQVALAKSYTSARMRETVAMGRSMLGGNGIVTDYRMAKIFADAEAIYTYEGSFEINTLIVGRAVTGVSAIV